MAEARRSREAEHMQQVEIDTPRGCEYFQPQNRPESHRAEFAAGGSVEVRLGVDVDGDSQVTDTAVARLASDEVTGFRESSMR